MSLKKTRKPAVMHTIGHQTPAVQHAIASMGGMRSGGTTRRRKRSSGVAKKGGSAKRKRASGGKPKRLVAGSKAAKAWGAKMRRARKKKG